MASSTFHTLWRASASWDVDCLLSPVLNGAMQHSLPKTRPALKRSYVSFRQVRTWRSVRWVRQAFPTWIAQNVERKAHNFLGHKLWARGYFVSTIGRTRE